MAHEIIKGSTFHVMEECGHWPQWEQPDEFNEIMLNFLTGLKK
jgi:pimeloyl-ACP methyl ester carboxylesterase